MNAAAQFKFVSTDLAPKPRGHYSQAVVANGVVYVSGQLPLLPGNDVAMPTGIRDQTRQALENVRQILEAAGSSVDRILCVNVFVTDVASWPGVNEVYQEFMGAHRPARTVVPSGDLHFGALVEINAMAAVAGGSR
jgi:2-iminobutanoate/2-iminopropanoate deaminase